MENHQVVDPIRLIFGFGLNEDLVIPPGSISTATPFPAQMEIDYVKVYKLKTDCNEIINTCTYDFPTHDNELKNEITIGGTGCENSVALSSSTYLRAANSIELSGDFTVPVGSTFFADANGECFNSLPVNNCGFIFNPCNYYFVGYDNGIKKEISLGQAGCTATISSGNTVSLKATDEITLKPGFTAESGSDVEIKIVNCQ